MIAAFSASAFIRAYDVNYVLHAWDLDLIFDFGAFETLSLDPMSSEFTTLCCLSSSTMEGEIIWCPFSILGCPTEFAHPVLKQFTFQVQAMDGQN